MYGEYKVDLLNGNHGIWLFVSKDGKVVKEQAGLKSIDEAMEYAKAVIKSEDAAAQAKRQEDQETQGSCNMD